MLANESICQRFTREARALGTIKHPNIVNVYQFENDGGTHFIVMEYVEGESLQARLPRSSPEEGR